MKLNGSKVVVTGGAGRLGRVIVEALINGGARVAVLDLDVEAIAGFTERQPRVLTRRVDLTVAEEVDDAVEAIVAELGSIEILINNAGLLFSASLCGMASGGLQRHSADEFDRVVRANLYPPFLTTRAVVAEMVRQRVRGLIVNVSSIAAAGNAGQTAYSAAKAGVDALTATWAKELGPLGIRVAGLAPGFCDTEATRRAVSEPILAEIRARVPIARLGRPEEIARSILAIVDNDFFHGKVLAVDGGLVL